MESVSGLKDEETGDNIFNKERTLALLDLYKKYRDKLGTYEMKTMKKMWEHIARDMSYMFSIVFAANKCENKFKVLERNFKKVMDNNNSTGRGRKCCPFEAELGELFKKKSNVHPVLLLSNSDIMPKPIEEPEASGTCTIEQEAGPSGIAISIPEPACVTPCLASQIQTPRKRKRKTNTPYRKCNDILVDIRDNLKSYYDQKLSLEKAKLEDRKRRTDLLEEYIKLKKQNM